MYKAHVLLVRDHRKTICGFDNSGWTPVKGCLVAFDSQIMKQKKEQTCLKHLCKRYQPISSHMSIFPLSQSSKRMQKTASGAVVPFNQ